MEDDAYVSYARYTTGISIHVLRMEDDYPAALTLQAASYFNPRPPYGGRPDKPLFQGAIIRISIHVLRMEDDAALPDGTEVAYYFNPRPPYGGRLASRLAMKPNEIISIHVLRMGCPFFF